MQIRRSFFLAAGLFLLTCRAVAAQDVGDVGLTMGYPSSIGVIWHVTDKVAIRPELSIAGSSTDSSSSSFSAENDTLNLATGISVLFYLRTDDRLKTYVSPRLTYARTTNENTSSGVTTSTVETTATSTGVFGSFGAQYELSDKFSVFGELGVGFGRAKTTGSTSQVPTAKGTTWNTRSGVGLVYYF
jgi:hypothetical protein